MAREYWKYNGNYIQSNTKPGATAVPLTKEEYDESVKKLYSKLCTPQIIRKREEVTDNG